MTKLIPLSQIKTIIRDLPVFDGSPMYWSSTQYFLPDMQWFRESYAPTVRDAFLKYPPADNRRDCTQAVRIALALAGNSMAQRAENAGIAIGRTVGGLYSTVNGITGSPGVMHDTCIFISDELVPYFYEPQNERITHAQSITVGDWSALFIEL